MKYILSQIKDNAIDYESLPIETKHFYPKRKKEIYDVIVIVGIRQRDDFVLPLIKSFRAAIGDKKISLILVEHDHTPRYKDIQGVDYVWLKCKKDEPYNRGLAFNVGFMVGTNARWILTHDADCLVQSDFFDKVFENIRIKDARAIQTFNKNRVVYCNEQLSKELINNKISIDSLSCNSPNTFTCKGKAMGGSLMVAHDLFCRVGMYDPELFTGYAPEDQFMWHKLSLFTTVHSCDNPVVDIFHLHHPFMGATNPRLKEMIKINERFISLSMQDKLEIINQKYLIQDKILWL